MDVNNLPSIGDRVFLFHREVIVINIIREFRLVKVHFTEEVDEFYIDVCAITHHPVNSKSISIDLIRRNPVG